MWSRLVWLPAQEGREISAGLDLKAADSFAAGADVGNCRVKLGVGGSCGFWNLLSACSETPIAQLPPGPVAQLALRTLPGGKEQQGLSRC